MTSNPKTPILILAVALGLLLSYFVISRPLKPAKVTPIADVIGKMLATRPLNVGGIPSTKEIKIELVTSEVEEESDFVNTVEVTEINPLPKGTKLYSLSELGPYPYLSLTSSYSTDNKNVYYGPNLIKEANLQTFDILEGDIPLGKGIGILYRYAKDKNFVYCDGKILPEANPISFRPIENGSYKHNYATDGKNVYFCNEPVNGADPKTFKILWENQYEGCGMGEYSVDINNVYHLSELVPGADPKTFKSLMLHNIGQDKRGYYEETKFLGPYIDPEKLVCNYG